MFRHFIEPELNRIRKCPQAVFLGDKVYGKLEDALRRKVGFVAGSTATHLISQVVAADNPFAATLPDLLTEEERNRARSVVQQQLDSGVLSLPEPLVECLELQLGYATDAFLEALARLVENRDAICDALLDGRRFQTIEDVDLSAGDTHNCGRSVAVFHTDAGKLVYKPHDLRADGCLREFAKRFFGEFVGVPRSIAFGEDFGVCEFVEKQRAEGADEAERFWRALGGLTVFAKLMGSTDLHHENILCRRTLPYLVDLETILSPISSEQLNFVQSFKTREWQTRSLGHSLILPARVEDSEISALTNTTESGIAPIVDGEIVTVRPFLPAFKEGYRTAYARVVEQREAIREAVLAFPADMTARIVLRPTRGYWMMLQKLYHHTALASQEGRRQAADTLAGFLRKFDATLDDVVVDSELAQMMRGDVPYFYTRLDSLSLCAEGEELVPGMFGVTAIGRVLDTLDAMGQRDESFDLSYIERAIRQYLPAEEKREKGSGAQRTHRVAAGAPHVAAASLSTEAAAEAAKEVLDSIFSLGIETPNGRLVWGYVDPRSRSLSFGGQGLFDGYTGLAVFACACAAVWSDGQTRERADALVEAAVEEMRWLCQSVEEREGGYASFPAGEGGGFGGILTGLALMRRYAPAKMLDDACERVLALLDRADFSGCDNADRIGGLAGLVSALCRFDEYRGCTTAIRNAADRILELKTLAYKDHVLWKTLPGIPRALSGAGHGMAGIAEALVSAADVLGDGRYLPAASDALSYERDAYWRYAGKFGTWADLREFPPEGYMHGYCAGAPGTGIMMSRIASVGRGGPAAHDLANLVRKSVDGLPLNLYDHLCCGNAAIAEYRLSTGNLDAAGRVLGAIYERSWRDGGYRDACSGASVSAIASLFNGIGGVGYEMLRYAHPETILSVL